MAWLVDRLVVDPAVVDPVRLLGGLIDIVDAGLDGVGPEEVVAGFGAGPPGQALELLDSVWRLEHPRTPEVVEALGGHHPAEVIAEAACEALVRSMLAGRRWRGWRCSLRR